MINGEKVKAMIDHWLSTPPNGYFGQAYGADVRNLLLRDLSSTNADQLIKQLRRDIPLVNQLDDSQISVNTEQVGFDELHVYLSIGNIDIKLGESTPQNADQDYYNVRAQ
ncbi:hypothetical protein [Psychrobacter sp. PAMC 21119]|uniref:hypothetical protein n=1 Tax=Psychrobacter sp. PAMC 21119 TaxID=1112209 RepID=UPI000287E9A6|nr:hypothetical protein [Psychrobacter sp. PAMC 21119]